MKVSIITSCYNREATIRGAIESVLEQDYPYIGTFIKYYKISQLIHTQSIAN